jgi:hypothetical protein
MDIPELENDEEKKSSKILDYQTQYFSSLNQDFFFKVGR